MVSQSWANMEAQHESYKDLDPKALGSEFRVLGFRGLGFRDLGFEGVGFGV